MKKPDPKHPLAACAILCACLLPFTLRAQSPAAAASPADPDHQVITEHLDMEMVKRHANFGYSDEEIQKYFNYPQTFTFDYTGMARDRIKAPPAPGMHPRVFFDASDLPEIRRKLAGTKPGKLRMDSIRAMLQKDLTGPGARFAALYAAAIQGQEDPKLLDVEVACPIIYECFRCLIDHDDAGGKRAAAALTTLAKMDSAQLDQAFAAHDAKAAAATKPGDIQLPLRDYQETKGLTQHGLLPLGYDFAYQWLTPAQRDAVRATLAKGSANMTLLDAEALPAFPANTSNWIPMHMRLLLLICSIEGEKGYDPGTYHRCVEGYKRYLNVGGFPAGDMYESMGKNFICTENLVPVANRGTNLMALALVRAQVSNYYLHAMDPWGGHFTFYDSLGGRGNTTPMFDVMIMKHIFPRDPAIDFVYRNTVGEAYERFGSGIHFGHPFHLMDGLVQAIFSEEYAPGTWEQAQAAATAGKPLTFFSNGSGNLITWSAWDKDALQLHFLSRSVSGGHQYADRTHFSIHALGRYWAIYQPLRQVEEHYAPRNRSVILIDGKGPGMVMARCAAEQDNADATFVTCDAKTAYDYTSGGNNRFPKGGLRVPFVANDFHLQKVPLPWMNMPWSDLPYWQNSMKGSELWLPNSPVQRAFRTAGLVRGKHPYVLIIDDIQKDEKVHDYDWGMILEDDLTQLPTTPAGGNDIVLGEPGKAGADARFMLVRILGANGLQPSTPPAVETFSLVNPPQHPIAMHRFAVRAHTVAPDFKMLLFPYRMGAEQPKTVWNAAHTQLSIEWSDQKDAITFAKAADGHTTLSALRDGCQIITPE